jgi:uncharacterized phage protein (TIGR01671 family)
MNNRFKFRFWCISENRFINDPVIHGDGKISVQSGICGRDYCHDVIIQQYTGWNDKNNKPIVEGDIVKFSRLFEKERKIKELKSFVRFHNGQFGFDLIGFNDMFFTLSDECGIEVIGNIFEHPELLN